MTHRILVIEDQEDNRIILRDLLTSAGFEVIEAMNGQAGVTMAEAEKPDLILMDIQLPVLDGYEATRQIKGNPALETIPVIAVTGSNGKTTVKDMTAAILRQRGEVFATQGNLNNEIGMPLSLLAAAVAGDASNTPLLMGRVGWK